MTTSTSQFQEVSFPLDHLGLTLAAKDWHSHNHKETIIMLHGWLDNANSFDLLVPHLKDYRCICLDLPGHGNSQHLSIQGSYDFLHGCEVLLGVLDHLQLKKYHLLGHSLGACIISMVAGFLESPPLASVFLVEGLGPFSKTEDELPEQFLKHVKEKKKAPSAWRSKYPTKEPMIQHRQVVNKIPAHGAKCLIERGVEKKGEDYRWKSDPRLLLPSRFYMTEAQVLKFLENNQAPTCYLSGNKGMFKDSEILETRKKKISHLQNYELEGHHHLHLENPHKVAQLIKDYYQSL